MAGLERRLKLLEGKREMYFSQISAVFETISKVKDETAKQLFLSQARHVEQLRTEYLTTVDEVNLLNLEINPDYMVNYQSVSAFDGLFCFVKEAAHRFEVELAPTRPQNRATAAASTRSEYNMKIPRIELPTFDGDIQNFPFFYETFKRVIHENRDLCDSERVHYLLSHLTGKARNVCAGIVPAGENYSLVWNALLDKYKDDRALGTTYLNQLFSFKSVNGQSASNLEKFIDKYAAIIAALKQLKIRDLSDFIFVHVGLKLVDTDTAKSFEEHIRGEEGMPRYSDFLKFVREQVKILERTSKDVKPASIKCEYPATSSGRINPRTIMPRALVTTQTIQARGGKDCKLCKANAHTHLFSCNKFQALSPLDKFRFIKDSRYCINCLSSQHTAFYCNSTTTCRKCNGRHHTLLHFDKQGTQAHLSTNVVPPEELELEEVVDTLDDIDEELTEDLSPPEVSYCTMSSTLGGVGMTQVLATAKVYATNRDGRDVTIRCLLDPGSQSHYITSKCCAKLRLKIQSNSPVTVKGIGGASQVVKGEVAVSIKSRFNTGPKFNIKALVLSHITSHLPTCQVQAEFLDNIRNLPIADDSWGVPGEIDLLIGVNLFAELLLPGKILGQPGFPDALETVLGYVIMGDAPTHSSPPPTSVAFHATVTAEMSLESLVKKFWELDEVKVEPSLSIEEKQCEDFYKATTVRESSGRYEVALPFKDSTELLGDSFQGAKRRFTYLERKFAASPKLKAAYDEVIKDYLEKSYLSPVSTAEPIRGPNFYIPHHAVLREDKVTSKVRPVLDASAKSSSGFSLNDILHTGPNLQRDLFTILLNLRLFPIAISSDIRQMYLRIGVRSQDRIFQRILYRQNFSAEINLNDDGIEPITTVMPEVQTFQFNCVPFGLKSSPYLAMRTVAQLAEDEGHRYPIAKEIVIRDIYMDDVASSLLNSEQASAAAHELIDLFKSGGFQLVKWSSNSKKVLERIPVDYRLSQSVEFDKDETLKILGLCWHPSSDEFAFKVQIDERPCTKRHMLSSVARLFDVLGLVAPVVLYAKLLIKELWILRIDWDEVPPQRIIRLWNQFQSELSEIAKVRFPRHVGVIEKCSAILLGFADASERAYGGVIYLHVILPCGDVTVRLICAKSKVAPLKIVSLARLELCAALLLSKIIKKVYDSYNARYQIHSVMAFSDSTVALSWIHSSPHRWQTFVANRVSKIQDNLSSDHFFHVKGSENPSDCLSRGLTPAQLVTHPLWWQGPPWVSKPRHQWPVHPFLPGEVSGVPELKAVALVTTVPETPFLYKVASKISSWSRLLRIVTYILKFSRKLPPGDICCSDINYSEREIIKAIQLVHFADALNCLKSGKICPPMLQRLTPYLKDDILRVGGRLANSNESNDYKHPILLPGKDLIVERLVRFLHYQNLHTGPELLMSILRNKFWILSARRLIRSVINKCNICFRCKPRPVVPIMADLPECRVQEASKAFSHTGCDYAGPFNVTPYKGRGITSRKAYICLFTCLTTRAIHIELASELSTTCFLAALKRFLSRRGSVHCLYTDHGTNFIGARTYLRELYSFLESEYKVAWEQQLAENKINWKLIPPHAPHFGGCWESNVKSVKSHLYRVVGLQVLTFEEMSTVLAQIESLLNSRPLTVLSADPSEPIALTPAHFLHTAPLTFLPASEASESVVSHLLRRHELVDQMMQSFWKRWRNEYLHTLQVRQKWNSPAFPVREGLVVVIMEDNLMPLHWPLGVIIKTYKGKDGVIRVVQVRTKVATYKRPVVKLCPLPSQ